MKSPVLTWFAILSIAILTASCTTKGSSGPQPRPYPFNHCAVIKKPFTKRDGAKHRRVHDGYEILFCCTPCVKAFDQNPEAFMAPIRAHYQSNGTPAE